MKKFISLLLSCLMAFGVFSPVVFADEGGNIILASNNQITKIITPENASDVQKYAADTLKSYIGEITGVNLEITDSDEDFDGNKIYLGERPEKDVKAESLPDGSYILREKDGDLYIVGSGRRGNIYGVYGFLEKYCGCRWYTKDFKVIPKSGTVSVPQKLDYVYKPAFEYTHTQWKSSCDAEYSLAHGLNGGPQRALTAEQGGTLDYISGFCHTLSTQFCSSKKYFESHPEYFALHDGKRTPYQLCLTNPDVLRIVTEEVLELARKKWDPSQPIQIISVTQHDNALFCECDECKKLDDAEESHAGTMITFANAVARAVKEAGYNNIAIDTFAYVYSRKPPKTVRPDDNVIVRLCSIECCFAHTLDDASCKQNADFMQDLLAWSKICNRLYVWDYVNNFFTTICLYPNFKVLQSNMQTFYKNGIKGVHEEGNHYMEKCDAEFGELKSYLLSKLMQDPYMDYDAAMNEFLEAYYGGGWRYLREFIDSVCEVAARSSKGHHDIYVPAETLAEITDDEIWYFNSLWEKAKAYSGGGKYLKHIRRSEISWKYWKCSNKKADFSNLAPCFGRMCAQDELRSDLREFGVVSRDCFNTPITDCPTIYLFQTVNDWKITHEKEWQWKITPIVNFLLKIAKALNKIYIKTIGAFNLCGRYNKFC